mmetsp:Transcript_52365/g.125043  ORF Transcript_52365/g.125043 Transcript_52365/m.125043 type:complete len:284 (-) Transcript_52365:98-949(-)
MWFVQDACGIVCVLIAYSLLTTANWLVMGSGWMPDGELTRFAYKALYEMLYVLGIWSHLTAMLTDPGAIDPLPKGEQPPEGIDLCTKCYAPKPPGAHHCSICNKCIRKMDHHCPWVNNCVGARNQKHFLLFVFYVQLQCWLAVVSLGGKFVVSANQERDVTRTPAFLAAKTRAERAAARRAARLGGSSELEVLGCLLMLVVAIIFALFTLVMSCDQVSNILGGTTGIDALQGVAPKPRSWRETTQEVMGKGPSLQWLLPTPVKRAKVDEDDFETTKFELANKV